MAALIAGGAAALAGGAAAYANAPGSLNLPKFGPKQATFYPLILSFLQSGGDISQLLVKKTKGRGKNGTWTLPDGSSVRKSETIKFGKDRIAIAGGARDVITKQFDVAQQEAVGQTQKNFDLIFGKDGPQFLKDKISNRPQQLRDAFGPAVSAGIREAIGGAAPAGTLTTDALLQRVGAGPAMQAESLFQQAEDVRNAQELGLAGVPGFGSGFGSNPNNFTQPQSLPFLQQLGLSAFQGGQFAPAYASGQSRQQSQGFKAGLFSGAGGQLGGLFGSYANQGGSP